MFEDAIKQGKRAQKIAKFLASDRYLYFKSLAGLANTYIVMGQRKKALDAGQLLLEYGQKHSDIRCITLGYQFISYSHFIAGDWRLAIEYAHKGGRISVDPLYAMGCNLLIVFSYAFLGEFQKIQETAERDLKFYQEVGCEVWGTLAEVLLGLTCIANGQMSRGLKMVENVRDTYQKNNRNAMLAMPEYILGKIFLQIAEGNNKPRFSVLARNIGFMMKNVPAASKKAEDHFNRAIEIAKEIGVKNWMAMTYLDMGLLHKPIRPETVSPKRLSSLSNAKQKYTCNRQRRP